MITFFLLFHFIHSFLIPLPTQHHVLSLHPPLFFSLSALTQNKNTATQKENNKQKEAYKIMESILCWPPTPEHGACPGVELEEQCLEKTVFFSTYQLQIASWIVVGSVPTFPSGCLDVVWLEPVKFLCMLPQSLSSCVYYPIVSGREHFLLGMHCLSSSPLPPSRIPEMWGRERIKAGVLCGLSPQGERHVGYYKPGKTHGYALCPDGIYFCFAKWSCCQTVF